MDFFELESSQVMKLREMTRTQTREQAELLRYTDSPEIITLCDGTTVTIRPLCAHDAPLLQAFYARLSPETIYARFLGTCKELPHQLVQNLAHVDRRTQVAWVATREQHADESIVAVARYWVIPESEPCLAEPAIVVEDRYQNRGLGTHLLKRLAAYARAHGVCFFVAIVRGSNLRILRLIRSSGLPIESKMEAGTLEIRVKLDAESGFWNVDDAIAQESFAD
jgi:GNAT superfamily N-acetyltransferase